MRIFIVLHHEIMGAPGEYWADEMAFYTARSLQKAIGLIKQSSVSQWSWWETQVSNVDGLDWPQRVGYFGLRGGKLAKQPYEKCVAIFEERGEARRISGHRRSGRLKKTSD
jgi:hypothetical protein